MRSVLLSALAFGLTACGGSSSSPTAPGGSSTVLQGQTVSAIDGSAAPNLTVRVGTRELVTTDGSGFFQVDVGSPGSFATLVRGGGVVERETTVNGPSSERTRVSLIPSDFDLTAFDELARTSNSRLQRWTSRPSLVVLGTVMNLRTVSSEDHFASGDQLNEQEIADMVAHLTEGLALLTGNTFTSFASVEVERPQPGESVNTVRTGKIVVGRYNGVSWLANTIGYGRWAETPDGTVVGGSMYLDTEFDQRDSRRRLLRIHELGHALGYLHVEARTSIMNPAIGPEPTDFDRAAAIVAFQRPPGNRSPDIDPAPSLRQSLVSSGGGRWMPPVLCR